MLVAYVYHQKHPCHLVPKPRCGKTQDNSKENNQTQQLPYN